LEKSIEKNNVVLICCDQLRADWLGCNGHPVVMTPQIDQLAQEGINFQSAFSECPACVPARRILMTGKGSYSIKMNKNRATQPFAEGPKIAEVMTQSGYQTFAAGKLHTCPPRNRIGFEEVQLNEEGRKIHECFKDDYEAFLADNGYSHLAYTHGMGNNEYGMRINPLPEPFTTTHWTAQKAMEFIERRDPTRPFFLHISFDKPHPSIAPTQEYFNLYKDIEMPRPVEGDWTKHKLPSHTRYQQLKNNYDMWKGHPLVIQQSLKGYAAMITHIDSMIGVFLGTLRENGLLDNTMIIFTSDHGDNLFDHGGLAKVDFFKGSCSIPYIICPPKKWVTENGFILGQLNKKTSASLMDIMPTVLEMCGISIPDSVEGQSLVPVLLDENANFREKSFGNCSVLYTVMDGRFKYIWAGDDGYEFLFDTHVDPRDCDDLAEKEEYKDMLITFRKDLINWLEVNDDPHVEDGKLKTIPYYKELLKTASSRTSWNNRGRH